MNYSIVIPAYNEEKRIFEPIDSYVKFFSKLTKSYEIIVSCDGCKDRTPQIVQDYSKKNKNVKPLIFEQNQGKGNAVIQGFLKSDGEIIGFVDSDTSLKPEEFYKLIKAIEEQKVDGAIASRRVKGASISIKQPLKRRISSQIFNIFVNLLFGLNVKDSQCGGKAFTKKAIKAVAPKIKSKKFEFDVELLWRMKKSGFKVIEVPVVWSHEDEGTFNYFGHGKKMVLNLIKWRLKG